MLSTTVLLAFFVPLAAAAPTYPPQHVSRQAPEHISRVAADDEYSKPEFRKWLEGAKLGDVWYYDKGNIRVQDEAANITKRELSLNYPDWKSGDPRYECFAFSRVTLQTNIDKADVWWSAWKKYGDCKSCDEGSCELKWDWSEKYYMTVPGSFDYRGVKDARDTINKTPEWNKGFKWETYYERSPTHSCPAGTGEQVSLWAQTVYGWSDIAQRLVQPVGSVIGSSSEFCYYLDAFTSDWQFTHIDWPVGGEGDIHVGCSRGEAAQC